LACKSEDSYIAGYYEYPAIFLAIFKRNNKK
jgi:hypothetical protein